VTWLLHMCNITFSPDILTGRWWGEDIPRVSRAVPRLTIPEGTSPIPSRPFYVIALIWISMTSFKCVSRWGFICVSTNFDLCLGQTFARSTFCSIYWVLQFLILSNLCLDLICVPTRSYLCLDELWVASRLCLDLICALSSPFSVSTATHWNRLRHMLKQHTETYCNTWWSNALKHKAIKRSCSWALYRS